MWPTTQHPLKALADYLQRAGGPYVLSWAAMADKNIADSLKLLIDAQHLFAVNLLTARAASVDDLPPVHRLWELMPAPTVTCCCAGTGLSSVPHLDARLVICGSFYTLPMFIPP